MILKLLVCVTSFLGLGKQVWGRDYKYSLGPAEFERSNKYPSGDILHAGRYTICNTEDRSRIESRILETGPAIQFSGPRAKYRAKCKI